MRARYVEEPYIGAPHPHPIDARAGRKSKAWGRRPESCFRWMLAGADVRPGQREGEISVKSLPRPLHFPKWIFRTLSSLNSESQSGRLPTCWLCWDTSLSASRSSRSRGLSLRSCSIGIELTTRPKRPRDPVRVERARGHDLDRQAIRAPPPLRSPPASTIPTRRSASANTGAISRTFHRRRCPQAMAAGSSRT